MKNIRIHYYSGTGNTAHAASRLAERFRKEGIIVDLIRITKGLRTGPGTFDLQVFLFPVYALSLPGSVKIYLRHFVKQTGKNARAAVIANHGMINMKGGINTGYESQSLDEAANALKRKGFEVVFMDKVGYPENITVLGNAPDKQTIGEIIAAADKKMDEMTFRILKGEKQIKKYFFLEKIGGVLFGMLLTYLGKWHIGKMYVADRNCNGCGLCVKGCPSHAIRLFNNRPRWNYSCDACLGCFNFCPKTAVQISLFRVVIMLVLTVGLIPLVIAIDHRIIGAALAIPFFKTAEAVLLGGLFKIIFGIVLYAAFYIATLYIMDKLFFLLEQLKFLDPIVKWTYSKKIRRYVAPGYVVSKK